MNDVADSHRVAAQAATSTQDKRTAQSNKRSLALDLGRSQIALVNQEHIAITIDGLASNTEYPSNHCLLKTRRRSPLPHLRLQLSQCLLLHNLFQVLQDLHALH